MKTVKITVNDIAAEVPENTSILKACRMQGIDIPTLCHLENELPDGSCRICVVEVEGAAPDPVVQRGLADLVAGKNRPQTKPAVGQELAKRGRRLDRVAVPRLDRHPSRP